MEILFTTHNDVIQLYKPSGIATHSPSSDREGMLELVGRVQKRKLLPLHRLDRGTSGVLLATTSKETASHFTELFSRKEIIKEYLFITDRKVSFSGTKSHSSYLKKDTLAETDFSVLNTHGAYSLIKASPKSGVTHQIRLHAQELGIPILGDAEHGGSVAPRLFLHAEKLTAPSYAPFVCEAPRVMRDLPLLLNPFLLSLITSYERRELLLDITPEEGLRLVHTEHPFIRIDLFGDHAAVYWYRETPPTSKENESLAYFFTEIVKKDFYLEHMKNRGSGETPTLPEAQKRWEVIENGNRYSLQSHHGFSPGLFLDQRGNRKFIQENCAEKKVLNLFAYTGGFSIAALKGEAVQVTSVDVSKSYLDRIQENIVLNRLDSSKHRAYVDDVMGLLPRLERRGEKFSYIIADPPVFGRSKKGTFSLKKDLDTLIKGCLALLEKDGALLFSCNLEEWTKETLLKKLQSICGRQRKVVVLPSEPDFELGEADSAMKAFLIGS